MKLPGSHKWWLLGVLLVPISIGACLVKKDSPALGCVQYWRPAPVVGCFGKTSILDLQVEPKIGCLEIEANNRSGGVLQIKNACAEARVLGDVEIGPQER